MSNRERDDRPRDAETTFAEDVDAAHRLGLLFTVKERSGPHARWEVVSTEPTDLQSAMTLARGRSGWRIGVLTTDGFIYWTSNQPDLLNSTVIHQIPRDGAT